MKDISKSKKWEHTFDFLLGFISKYLWYIILSFPIILYFVVAFKYEEHKWSFSEIIVIFLGNFLVNKFVYFPLLNYMLSRVLGL